MALNQPNRPHHPCITRTVHGEEVLAPRNCDRSLRTLQEYSKDVGLLLCIATCKANSWLKGFLVLMFSMGLIYESEPNIVKRFVCGSHLTNLTHTCPPPPFPHSSSLCLRYTTFNHVYNLRWKDILRFRDRSLFSHCEICKNLKDDLSNKRLTFDQKLGALQLYRSHLHDQFCDRTICWRLQSESADTSTDLVAIATDGLDQAKFALPRDPNLRSSAHLFLVLMSTLCFYVVVYEQGAAIPIPSNLEKHVLVVLF